MRNYLFANKRLSEGTTKPKLFENPAHFDSTCV
jgi:hypothetical protein